MYGFISTPIVGAHDEHRHQQTLLSGSVGFTIAGYH
jgi:hypothetical protein